MRKPVRGSLVLPSILAIYAVWTVASTSPPIGAQTAVARDPPMEAAAATVAESIARSKQGSVIVFDFSGPGARITMLGQKLADDFSAALEKSATVFHVESRTRITDAIQQYRFTPEFLADHGSALTLATDLHVKALVTGELSIDGDKLVVLVSAYRVPDGKGITGYRVTWPLTQEMRELLGKDLAATPASIDFSNVPAAGENGYSTPICASCPRPDLSAVTAPQAIHGVVVLEVIVREDGSIGDFRVVKGTLGSPTATVIDAVKQWKLKPAKGPDGKPAAVRQIVEISFQIG